MFAATNRPQTILDNHYTINAVAHYMSKGLRFVAATPSGQVWGADTHDSDVLASIAAEHGCTVIDLQDAIS